MSPSARPLSPPSARLGSPGFTNGVQGDSVFARLQQEAAAYADCIPALQAQIGELQTTNAKLEQQHRADQELLRTAKIEIEMLETAKGVNEAMGQKTGSLRLSGRVAASDLWRYISFSTLKRERDLRLAVEANYEADMNVVTTALRQEIQSLEARLEAVGDAHARAIGAVKEDLERLRVGNVPKDLPAVELTKLYHVNQAAADRVWEDDDDDEEKEVDLSTWSFADFLEPINLHRVIAESFDLVLGGPEARPPIELKEAEGFGRRAQVREIGKRGSAETIRAILRAAPLLDKLADTIWSTIAQFTGDIEMIERGKEKLRKEQRLPPKPKKPPRPKSPELSPGADNTTGAGVAKLKRKKTAHFALSALQAGGWRTYLYRSAAHL